MKCLKKPTLRLRRVRRFEGLGVIERWKKVRLKRVRRGGAFEEMGKEGTGFHEVLGVEWARYNAIETAQIRVLESEKSEKGLKSLLGMVNYRIEGRERGGQVWRLRSAILGWWVLELGIQGVEFRVLGEEIEGWMRKRSRRLAHERFDLANERNNKNGLRFLAQFQLRQKF